MRLVLDPSLIYNQQLLQSAAQGQQGEAPGVPDGLQGLQGGARSRAPHRWQDGHQRAGRSGPVMGVSQSRIMLSLCRSQTELPDPVLEFMIRELVYADDLPSGVMAQEIADLQNELWSSIDWEELRRPCNDWTCLSSLTHRHIATSTHYC